MRKGTEGDARTVVGSVQERSLRVSFVDSAGAALLRDPVPEHEAEGVGDLRGEDRREVGAFAEGPAVVCPEESERRIVPVARCCGSSGDSGEPFPGWRLIGDGVWAKRDWVISHIQNGYRENGYRVRRHETDSRGAPYVTNNAVLPTMEAAVMWAELKGDE